MSSAKTNKSLFRHFSIFKANVKGYFVEIVETDERE